MNIAILEAGHSLVINSTPARGWLKSQKITAKTQRRKKTLLTIKSLRLGVLAVKE
jgi:hypothetical protein